MSCSWRHHCVFPSWIPSQALRPLASGRKRDGRVSVRTRSVSVDTQTPAHRRLASRSTLSERIHGDRCHVSESGHSPRRALRTLVCVCMSCRRVSRFLNDCKEMLVSLPESCRSDMFTSCIHGVYAVCAERNSRVSERVDKRSIHLILLLGVLRCFRRRGGLGRGLGRGHCVVVRVAACFGGAHGLCGWRLFGPYHARLGHGAAVQHVALSEWFGNVSGRLSESSCAFVTIVVVVFWGVGVSDDQSYWDCFVCTRRSIEDNMEGRWVLFERTMIKLLAISRGPDMKIVTNRPGVSK